MLLQTWLRPPTHGSTAGGGGVNQSARETLWGRPGARPRGPRFRSDCVRSCNGRAVVETPGDPEGAWGWGERVSSTEPLWPPSLPAWVLEPCLGGRTARGPWHAPWHQDAGRQGQRLGPGRCQARPRGAAGRGGGPGLARVGQGGLAWCRKGAAREALRLSFPLRRHDPRWGFRAPPPRPASRSGPGAQHSGVHPLGLPRLPGRLPGLPTPGGWVPKPSCASGASGRCRAAGGGRRGVCTGQCHGAHDSKPGGKVPAGGKSELDAAWWTPLGDSRRRPLHTGSTRKGGGITVWGRPSLLGALGERVQNRRGKAWRRGGRAAGLRQTPCLQGGSAVGALGVAVGGRVAGQRRGSPGPVRRGVAGLGPLPPFSGTPGVCTACCRLSPQQSAHCHACPLRSHR